MLFINRLVQGFGLVFVLFLVCSSFVSANTTLSVKNFYCVDTRGEPRETANAVNICKIGDWIKVDVPNLKEWEQSSQHSVADLVLVLDGGMLVGRNAYYDNNALGFLLKRNRDNEENMRVWKTLLARTSLFEPRKMSVALGLKDSSVRYAPDKGAMIALEVASGWRIAISVLLFVGVIILFYRLVRGHGLLRDLGAGNDMPYSLGASQLAFWSLIIIGGYLYLWLVAGELNTLTPGVLGLIGISAATGLTATAIGASKSTGVEASSTALPPVSKSFLMDILSSDGKVTLPRFQMLVWTLVLGLVFVHSIYSELAMPEFDTTLLGLMGISSGTYVGFKVPSASGK